MKNGNGGKDLKTRFRVHRFDIRMTTDQSKLEQFLNSLEGEVVAIFPKRDEHSTSICFSRLSLHSREARVDSYSLIYLDIEMYHANCFPDASSSFHFSLRIFE